jgi:hypothetical protein
MMSSDDTSSHRGARQQLRGTELVPWADWCWSVSPRGVGDAIREHGVRVVPE